MEGITSAPHRHCHSMQCSVPCLTKVNCGNCVLQQRLFRRAVAQRLLGTQRNHSRLHKQPKDISEKLGYAIRSTTHERLLRNFVRFMLSSVAMRLSPMPIRLPKPLGPTTLSLSILPIQQCNTAVSIMCWKPLHVELVARLRAWDDTRQPRRGQTRTTAGRGDSLQALQDLLCILATIGCTVVLTFPQSECSNGLSGRTP